MTTPTSPDAPPLPPAEPADVLPGAFALGREPIRAELFGPEGLEARARQIARASARVVHTTGRHLLARLGQDAHTLQAAHERLAAAFAGREPLTGEAEWFLDNYHIISEAVREVRTDLPYGYYRRLPKLTGGPLAGLPRVYWLALELVAHTDSALEETTLARFVQAYQEQTPLTIGELWAVPIMLRVALVENLSRLARGMIDGLHDHAAARARVQRFLAADHGPDAVSALLADAAGTTEAGRRRLLALLQALRAEGVPRERLEQFEGAARERGVPVEDWLREERQRQAANQVTVSNCVTSLRLLSSIDWPAFYERASLVDALLRRDPAGVYPRQDFATRDRYRQAVEVLARGRPASGYPGRDELDVCRALLQLAEGAALPRPLTEVPPEAHVGYYLIGDGRPAFERQLGYRPTWRNWALDAVRRWARPLYFGALALVTVLLLALLVAYGELSSASLGWGWLVLIIAAGLLPASELAVGLVNHLVTKLIPPHTLPKLDFSRGIPPECATFVVIPTLLTSPENNAALVERLEIHYLSNPDPRLRFALLTDWADATAEHLPTDEPSVQAVLAGVRELNRRHAPHGPPKFFLFHRRRLWNPQQDRWMGWERKRGKLSEFNRLLQGARDTTYSVLSADPAEIPRVRYVITLDSDTQMPRESAPRLIGTLAHPLNRARFDPARRRVVAGYSILQPRVSISLPAARRSRFAQTLAGSAGIDPYTTATSDVYQDLFGLGTFTGKGIYDVPAFEAATGPAFPENHILSHDLIEGNFARCALVTDIEFIDDLPSRYNAYSKREHRWVRGDWQLLPWLGRRVPAVRTEDRGQRAEDRQRVPNPLPLVERWKVFDNLRRSLVPPALVLWFALAWTVFPALSGVWTLAGLAVPFLPLLLNLPSLVRRLIGRGSVLLRLHDVVASVVATSGQAALQTVFLAHQAWTLLDAVGRTLARLYVTRRNLLEWETAAATERRLGNSLRDFVRFMAAAPATAVALTALLALVHPGALLVAGPLLAAWLVSPAVAWWVSLPAVRVELPLTEAERRALRRIARKTWDFFERFVTAEDHGLPPDNYQESPKGELAHRTSPTNIGLSLMANLAGHDFGYISLPRMLDRTELTLTTLERLERHSGHFLNWYDTLTLAPLEPRYVSTVDSGNLMACLVTLRQGLLEKLRTPLWGPSWCEGLRDTTRLAEEALRAEAAHLSGVPERLTVLQSVAALLEECPPDLFAWADWLERVSDLVGRFNVADLPAETETYRWLDRLAEQVQDRRTELAELAPWVGPLRALADAPPGLRDTLGRLASPRDLAGAAPRAADELAAHAGDNPRTHEVAEALRAPAAAELVARAERLAEQAAYLAAAMDFRLLYDESRHLFSIGLNLTAGRLDNSHYDLLASESALTSFLCIARGDAHRKHWFQLGRPVTRVGDSLALVSWGGTMFEYLMPRLFLHTYPQTLLDESRHSAVARQIHYGHERGVPWGISESGYYLTDADLNYQYQSFGVPGLGLKRGLEQDLVVAPYATVMAVMVRPHEAVANFPALAAEGGEGPFGFYEAIDYTPSRVPEGKRNAVVQSYMAHHQGMGFLSIANALLGEPFVRRLYAEPMVRATELLLQEKVPWEAPLLDVAEDVTAPRVAGPEPVVPVSRRIATPDTPLPRTHLISNGEYTVFVTNAGGGRSTCRDFDVTRWREDRTTGGGGQFVYVRDLDSGAFWAAGYQPVCRPADAYEAVFAIDKAEFRRRDGALETLLEVTVTTEHPGEVRRVTVTNHDDEAHTVELTSYVELALAPHGADLAHPAFAKLFLETEYLPTSGALLCRRRPRADGEKPVWAVHVAAIDGTTEGEIEFDSDRASFVGRGRSLAAPAALEPGAQLGGNVGAVLDPVFSLRRRLRVPAGASASVTFTTAVAGSREEAVALADRFQHGPAVVRAFELAWAHGPVELQHLGISAGDAHLFQRLAGHLIFASNAFRAPPAVQKANRRGREGLWRYGISGDRPILLVSVREPDDLGLVRRLLQAHTYWRNNGLPVDLVILNEWPTSYNDEFQQGLQRAVRVGPAREWFDRPGGVFLRQADAMTDEDRTLLRTAARVVLDARDGSLEELLDRQEPPPELPGDWAPETIGVSANGHPRPASYTDPEPLLFDNGCGGFSGDGREYVITVPARDALGPGRLTPAPWVNVLANPAFGCLVSESALGCTWAGNSQTNRLTPWSNDPVLDPPSEAVYLRDEASGVVWTPTPRPLGRGAPVRVRHGLGYTAFEQTQHDLTTELTVFVPPEDAVKFVCLRVTNYSSRPRRLSATYYAEWVLGGQRETTGPYVVTEVDATSGALFARNNFRDAYAERVAFADVLLRPRTVTADRTEFLGRNRTAADPAALGRQGLSGRAGPGLDPCAALQVRFDLDAGAEREVVFVLGEADDPVAARALLQRYREPVRVHDALAAVRQFWDDLCGAVQVQTPDPALDLLLNRWLPYQVLGCRVWGRTAFYQSSGAFGFRDQLQDVLALAHAAPEVTRGQLLLAAGRQFAEGDVQHWWHPPTGAGVRTRISDDRLWLPFAVLYYLAVTGDAAVLDASVPFLKAPGLKPEQEDSYGVPEVGAPGSLYEHCARAIDCSLTAGPHGLPLIGTGDWNDGFNRVGDGGKGESVWLAWFLLTILPEFARLAEARDEAERAGRWRDYAEGIRKAVEASAWDGDWYRRAYFDDGRPLGSRENAECQIDSLAQTWAVLCGQADPQRAAAGMRAVWERLVRPDGRLILLFTPPCDTARPSPGYVAGYLPGIRENGGQYTHGVTWVVEATARLGEAERAVEQLDLLNPIRAAADAAGVERYKLEPYVLAGDVYSNPQHVGRGGWSWYTGSAGWYYRIALEALLGVQRRGDRLTVRPCLPRSWAGFTARLRFGKATYEVTVENRGGGRAVQEVSCDGERLSGGEVVLRDDGREHEVRVKLG